MIPTSCELMLPILKYSESIKDTDTMELEKHLAIEFNLSKEEKILTKNSGTERLFLNKIRWAKTHLSYAGLIEFTMKNFFTITVKGIKFIKSVSGKITEKTLYQFKEYVEKRLHIVFEYAFCMPNKWTFQMEPAMNLLVNESKGIIVDPSCGQSDFATIRNDINADSKAHCNFEAEEFLKKIRDNYADTVVLDLPFSPEQISRSYKDMVKPQEPSSGLMEVDRTRKVTMQDTQSSFYSQIKDQVSRILKKNGIVISFGWNSGGMGKCRGFKKTKIKLLNHGGAHNDTIITVEEKI